MMQGASHRARWAPALFLLSALTGCTGCDPDDLGALIPAMSVEPEEVAVPSAPVAQDTMITVQVFDNSNVELLIEDIYLTDADPAFEIVERPPVEERGGDDWYVVGSREREPIRIRVRPVVVGEIEATLVLEAERAAEPSYLEVPIRVQARDLGLPDIAVDPEVVLFDRIGQDSVVRQSIQVTNEGVRDLIIDETTFIPDTPGDDAIRLTLPIQPGWALAPGDTVSMDVTFAPTDTVVHAGNIVIRSNDPDEAELRIPVTGQGVTCPVAVAELLDDPEGIEPLDTVRLEGSGSYTETPDTEIATYEWRLEQRPVGSTAVVSTANTDRVELTTDLAGDYQVRLTVYDDTGVRSCEDAVIPIRAEPTDELHIQLVWDHPTADLDLHLLREGGQPFTHEGDCYFSNRQPEWFPSSPAGNPSLDADDDEGYGPENINVETPLPGTKWKVLIHYWNKQTDGDPFTLASLRIYARGQQVADIAQSFEEDETLWTAAEISWPEEEDALPEITQIGLVEAFPRPF